LFRSLLIFAQNRKTRPLDFVSDRPGDGLNRLKRDTNSAAVRKRWQTATEVTETTQNWKWKALQECE